MKYVKMFITGLVLTILGVAMFLQNLTFKDPSNTGFLGDLMGALFGNASPKAISGALFVVIFLMLLFFAFSPNGWTLTTLLLSVIVVFLITIGSLDVTVAEMSGLKVGVIAVMIMVGVGMLGGSIVKLTVDAKKECA